MYIYSVNPRENRMEFTNSYFGLVYAKYEQGSLEVVIVA